MHMPTIKYHMVQISNEAKFDEIDKRLVICQNFLTKYIFILALANVAPSTVLLFFVKFPHQKFSPNGTTIYV